MKNSIYYFFVCFIFYLAIWMSLAQDDATATIHNTILSDSPTNNSTEERNDYNNKETNQNFDEQQPPEESASVINDLEPSSVEVLGSFSENNNININNNDNSDNENSNVFNKQVFAEATSQNSGVGNEILSSGPPVVVTLSDVATTELQQRATIPSQKNPENTKNDSSQIDFLNQSRSEPNNASSSSSSSSTTPNKLEELKLKENLTEEIPSFSEWAQKQLEEAEKNKNPENVTHQPSNGRQAKHRWKNYASLDCGAKIVANNPEAVSPSAILSPSRDEYKLNTCNGRIWFIVELCEAIQAKKIDFANFELFSSSPKDFTVSVSDRFPTREWSNVGQFTAKDERDIQSFDLHPFLFGKYIKVEVKSHYGSEHYCPISLFKVYGTSEFEVLQKEDAVHAHRLEDDDDDDDESLDVDLGGDASKNLFSSATDAVISMVKKAAQVLGNKSNNTQSISTNTNNEYTHNEGMCTSPSHLVVCDNCTESLFWDIYGLLSCKQKQIKNLAEIPRIRQALTNSSICHKFGLDFRKVCAMSSIANSVQVFFSEQFLGAMCNTVAIMENKVVLNTSKEYSNSTESKTEEEIINIETSEPHVLPQETLKEITTEILNFEPSESNTKTTSDFSVISQIKPTKTLSHESVQRESNTEEMRSLPEVITETETVSNFTEKIEQEQQDEKELLNEVFSGGGGAETSTENLDEHLEHFINEFQNGESLHPIATTSSTPQAQKESVFLRLSNRIKALERNMSLSGQYLEELSKRYKKQVEEIQKVLDKTILSMSEEAVKKDERSKQLEERVAVLTASVEALLAEKNSWSSTVYCIVISTLVTLFVISFCYTKTENSRRESVIEKPLEIKRRKSIDVVQHNRGNLEKKTRRPSDQALKIVRSSMESKELGYISKKKKKKKQVVLKRSNSINTLSEESEYLVFKPVVNSSQVWDRQKSAPACLKVDWVEGKHLEEVPFVLEDSEHSSLEPLVLAAAAEEDVKVPVAPPNYLKTALTARSVRINNGDGVSGGDKKWMSVVEPSLPSNGNVNSAASEETPKKEKKSFKKILRKVF